VQRHAYGSNQGLTTPPLSIVSAATRGTTGDVNGDGFTDLLVSTYANAYVFYGSPSGLPATPDTTLAVSNAGFSVPIFADADFDGDGYDDLVAGNANDLEFASVFAGSATGTPTARTYVVPNPARGNSVALTKMRSGDFTADALDDLAAVGGFMEGVTFLAGHAGGLVNTPVDAITGLTDNTGQHGTPVTGPFGGDFRSDFVIAYPAAKGQANGAIFGFIATSSLFAATPDSAFPNGATTDNFGTDATSGTFLAQADVAAIAVGAPNAYGTGRVAVFSSAKPFTFAFELVPPAGADTSFGEQVQSPGDFNGDGIDDLVVSWPEHSGTGVVNVYTGPVTATSVPRVLASPSAKQGDAFGGILY
jgi:hypothetical protein